MKTPDFKTFMRPQLEKDLLEWYVAMSCSKQDKLCKKFKVFMSKLFGSPNASKEFNTLLSSLPVEITFSSKDVINQVTTWFMIVFLASMEKYEVLDRTAPHHLKVYAYQKRLSNALAEVIFVIETTSNKDPTPSFVKASKQNRIVNWIPASLFAAPVNVWGDAKQKDTKPKLISF